MKKKIAVLPGDGIGPEIVEQAVKALKSIEKKFQHEFELEYGLIGAAAIDAIRRKPMLCVPAAMLFYSALSATLNTTMIHPQKSVRNKASSR